MVWLLVAAIGLPLVEISLFVTVGGWIGLWPTLLIVVGTALSGIWIVRHQGTRASNDLRHAMMTRQDPAQLLAAGALNVVAGLLLIMPGFFTDACGLLLLLPPVQRQVIEALRRGARRKMAETSRAQAWESASDLASRPKRADIIDGTWEELPAADTRPPSGWTRH